MAMYEIGINKNKKQELSDKTIIPFLRDYLGYDTSLMKQNVSVKSKNILKTIDIVFYALTNEVKKPYLLVIIKKIKHNLMDVLIEASEQHAKELKSPYFLVTDGNSWLWFKTNLEYDGNSSPTNEIHYFKITGEDKLSKIKNLHQARTIIKYCHDVIWNEKSSSPEDALKELSKFVIAKIIDEQEVTQHLKESYEFKIFETTEDALEIKNRINFLLLKATKKDSELFVDKKPELTLKPYSIVKIVQKLQNFSLINSTEIEILGETYQELLKQVYTDKVKGQRFTPSIIVDLVVDLINPQLNETIYDPACGTGGFLVGVLQHVKTQISKQSKHKSTQEQSEFVRQYATNCLYGTDIDSTVIQLAKANMIVHGDGHASVIAHDGLESSKKLDDLFKDVFQHNGFDIILTNPPFGGVKIDPDVLVNYELSKNVKSELTQVLFIERCLKLLKPGGKLAIVLPEGILNNFKQSHIRKYILEHSILKAIVSLPNVTFKPYGAGPKTSILFLQKKTSSSDKQDNVVMAQIENIGYTISGKEEKTSDVSDVIKQIKKCGIKWR